MTKERGRCQEDSRGPAADAGVGVGGEGQRKVRVVGPKKRLDEQVFAQNQ